MTDRLDDLLFSIGEEQNDRVDFDQMYADLLQKQKEEEKKSSTRRSRFVRYGAMAACGVALIGIGTAMLSGSRNEAAPMTIVVPMTDEAEEEAPQSVEAAPAEDAPMEEAGTEAPMMAAAPEMRADETAEAAEAEDTAGGSWDGATLAMQTDDTDGIEIGVCPDAESRLKAAGIAAEPYEGDDAPREGYVLMLGEGEAIWNTGSGVYRVTLNGDIAEQLKELCE